jgi:glycine C-acetyltransferase
VGRVDIITGTLRSIRRSDGRLYHGKKKIIEIETAFRLYFLILWLLQLLVTSIKVFEIRLKRDKLEWNTNYFKDGKKSRFDIIDGDSAIVPVMLMMQNCHKIWLMNY